MFFFSKANFHKVVTKRFGKFWGEELESVNPKTLWKILPNFQFSQNWGKKKTTNGYKKSFSCYQFHLLGKFEIFCHFHSIFIFIYMVWDHLLLKTYIIKSIKSINVFHVIHLHPFRQYVPLSYLDNVIQ